MGYNKSWRRMIGMEVSRLQRFTKGYKDLQRFTKIYKGLQRFTKIYKGFYPLILYTALSGLAQKCFSTLLMIFYT